MIGYGEGCVYLRGAAIYTPPVTLSTGIAQECDAIELYTYSRIDAIDITWIDIVYEDRCTYLIVV